MAVLGSVILTAVPDRAVTRVQRIAPARAPVVDKCDSFLCGGYPSCALAPVKRHNTRHRLVTLLLEARFVNGEQCRTFSVGVNECGEQ